MKENGSCFEKAITGELIAKDDVRNDASELLGNPLAMLELRIYLF